ncbi:hypothetical protein PWG15_02665 [Ensifer adhaerens]|uniref:hypothetical protein n=1 Tax=Ensifer adhaerens TaxID=106592 RepID=UPI0023A97D56|nr:hypothetical protein [Ensifer adhaerens]WDZ77437.1 hypothetical protein PWG15_02665 [Ensifer adhaerens]
MAVFKLSFLSQETATPSHELKFDADAGEIARVLDLRNGVFLDHAYYRLDQNDLTLLASALGLALPKTGEEAVLRRPHALDTVPYLVHTGYELPLMLEGRKPFAHFSDDPESPWLEEARLLFAPHVDAGALVLDRFEVARMCPTTTGGEKEQRVLYLTYALPGDEWRFDLFRQRCHRLFHDWRPWTAEDEREEGLLLGYTEEQCDWWLANRFRRIAAET